MAKILGRMLQDQGFEVHYTRTTDAFISLEERTARANAKDADLFISLPVLSDSSIKGLEIYYLNLATDAQSVRVATRKWVFGKKISDMQFILFGSDAQFQNHKKLKERTHSLKRNHARCLCFNAPSLQSCAPLPNTL